MHEKKESNDYCNVKAFKHQGGRNFAACNSHCVVVQVTIYRGVLPDYWQLLRRWREVWLEVIPSLIGYEAKKYNNKKVNCLVFSIT